MDLPTLDEFIDKNWNSKIPHSAYVREEGYESLYVRLGRHYLGGKTYDKVFTIARVEVTFPGKGIVWILIDKMLAKGIPVQVECVHNKRFQEKLLERVFAVQHENCYYKIPTEG